MKGGQACAGLASVALLACAGYAIRVPDGVRGYEIVVPGRDELSRALGTALARQGLRVRPAVRGGNRPAAVLIHFVFRERTGAQTALYGRLADTRSGVVVAAAQVPLDTTPQAARDSVVALVRALLSDSP